LSLYVIKPFKIKYVESAVTEGKIYVIRTTASPLYEEYKARKGVVQLESHTE
jgi:hypothetical protein